MDNIFYEDYSELDKICGLLRPQSKSQIILDYSTRFHWDKVLQNTKELYDDVVSKYR